MANRPEGSRAGPTVVDDDTEELLAVLTGLEESPPPATHRRRRTLHALLGLGAVSLLLIGVTGVALYALSEQLGNNVGRVPDVFGPLADANRPAATPALTFLLVGTDSRSDAPTTGTDAEPGTDPGSQRSDVLMLARINPSRTGASIVSIPRDSWVDIPGHGKNKINAAYAFGGPKLLVQTVEQATGLRIDSYVETGLGGYAQLVDAVGGIDVCVKRALKDAKAHINVKAGCQTFDGATALGYARARYADPRGDLGRVERQRQVLAAIAGKTLSPSVLALPWRSFPAASAGAGALTVDEDMSPTGLLAFVQAMRSVAGGGGLSLTVPVANAALQTSNAGEAVQWNTTQAAALFDALRADDTDKIKPLADAQKAAAAR